MRVLEVVMVGSAVIFYLICIASASALANERRERRYAANKMNASAVIHASLAPLRPENLNGNYLRQIPGEPRTESSINSQIFDKTISAEMTSKYNAYYREYSERENYRLNTQVDYLKYQKSNQDLVEWTVKKLLQHHFENTVKKQVEDSAKRIATQSKDSGTKAAASAVVAISRVQKAISNTTVDLGQDTKTRFKYDFPSGVMRVGMTSPALDAMMDYRVKAADPEIGAIAQPERLSVGVSRKFASINAATSARYGMLSQTVNCGMNKQLVGPVSAQVDQVHNIRDTSKDETVYRLSLGLSF